MEDPAKLKSLKEKHRRTEQLLQEERLSSDAAYADLARSARDNDRLREQIAALKESLAKEENSRKQLEEDLRLQRDQTALMLTLIKLEAEKVTMENHLQEAEGREGSKASHIRSLKESLTVEEQMRQQLEMVLQKVNDQHKADASPTGDHNTNDHDQAQDAPDDVLYFVPKLRPAVADGADEISYHGVIIDGALVCWVSFPGMYKAGWDGLVDGRHGDSVACVFLCEPKDGLGKHADDTENPGKCFCHRIYGKRNFRDFGYLHNIKKRRRACSEDELQRILQKAEAMHSDAIVFADDTPEQIALMEKKAEELWKEHGEIAAWGCEWYRIWLQKVEEAVRKGQTLRVVFFPGQCGEGTVSMGELPKADLWDGIGCGGSQKCEIATLKARGYKYEEVDVGEFLTGQFKRGDEAEALDGSTWRRCEVLDVPKKMISKEDVATWQVECKLSGRVFDSKHVRSSRDSLKSLLAAFHSSHDSLEKLFGEVGITIEKAQESGPRNGAPALSVKVEIKNIKQAHLLRDRVLEGELDIQLNKILSEKAPSSHTWDIGIEKNHFIELYERTLPGLLELTPHQYQKLQELESGNSQNLHLAAPAGAGKTFVALRYVVRHLRSSRSGRLLYVAPNRALLFHFVQWLMASLKAKSIDPRRTRIWERLLLKHQGQKAFWRPVLDGRHLKLQETPLGEDEFSLVVVDEAHQLFASGDEMDLLTLPRKKLLLLSDTSQSTHLHHHFPTAHYVELSEVIRSTQRIVAGAMPFQHAQSASSVQGMGTEGPPLKSFLFEVESEKTMMQDYVKHTVDTMWHVLQTFPGVSLSRRLALLVKDETFLQDFKPLMVQKIQEELPARRFAFVSCEECCSYLPSHLVPHSSSRDEEEIIVLDAVQNSRGLEQLIVVSIALDTSIDGNADNETRSYLYTGITRAQLQAVVVNHFIPDGWLAFLGTLKLKNEKFTQRAALAAIRKDAATSAVADAPRPATEKQDKEAAKQHTEVPDPGALRHKAGTQQGDEMSADKKADQDLKDMQSRADAVKVAAKELSELPELRVKGTSVWDTASNAINTKIVQLKFDPRISRLSEEMSWMELQPTGRAPSERALPSAVYDPHSHFMVVFGGGSGDGSSAWNDLWKLDLKEMSWMELQPTGRAPSERFGHSAVYDPHSHSMVVFGGRGRRSSLSTGRNDLWKLDLKEMSWMELQPTGRAPSERTGHSAVYDSHSHSMVVFGGTNDGSTDRTDLWKLDLKEMSWMELQPTGRAPSERLGHSAVYDPHSHSMVVFGGLGGSGDGSTDRNDLWKLDLKEMSWMELQPTGRAPSERFGHSAVYDPHSHSMVVFGGWGFGGDRDINYGDVWCFSLQEMSWRQLHGTGTGPCGRNRHSAVYDPDRQSMVVFAGYGGGDFNDVWSLDLQTEG